MKKALRIAWMAFALIVGIYLTLAGLVSLIPRIILIVRFPLMRMENIEALTGQLIIFAIGVLLIGEFNWARKRFKKADAATIPQSAAHP